ncbi:MAG TPA: nuclear transport factor 2 family protein [Mycobacteriales bacterium]|nr:nuclear transport factor 2 family protein [Mycobacteriales bacterium]
MGDERAAVLAANAELYAAFEAGDPERMEAVWDDADDVRCVHPGWPLLVGRSRVLRSWSVIMANTSYIQFFLTDVEATVDGDVAVVTCEENILTAVTDPDGLLSESAKVVSTNVFRRRSGSWRLWAHHGSPVLAPAGDPE